MSESALDINETSSCAPVFRSVLPHEPPLSDAGNDDATELQGYLLVQGSFTPKLRCPAGSECPEENPDAVSEGFTAEFWIRRRDQLETVLLEQFRAVSASSAADVSLEPSQLWILDRTPPYTKIRLSFESPSAARRSLLHYRELKLSPFELLSAPCDLDEATLSLQSVLLESVNRRPLQFTEITSRPLPPNVPSWTRSTPPKFRRLVSRPDEDSADLERERQTTRFVVLTNLLDESADRSGPDMSQWELHPQAMARAIRSVLAPLDSSGYGVEVFVPSQISKRSRYCHVGMRSAVDAQAVVTALQEQVVSWPWSSADGDQVAFQSAKLFVDYAAITQRSVAKAVTRDSGNAVVEIERGQRGGPQCTSTTDHVTVPGLVLIPDFISQSEEATLMAVLTGPQAPWAPSQRVASNPHAALRRAVQHYGYVFDYQTADVLRDRSCQGADCPPMPALPNALQSPDSANPETEQQLEEFILRCLDEGRGWEVLAGVIQRTRQQEFPQEFGSEDVNPSVRYPHLNQLTVNQYFPGEGIGSHVDTPSAFSDGLISISLNGGITMEFRRVGNGDEEANVKKLVYLPPRSLLLMSGDARYKWEHMIVSRMTDTHDNVVLPRQLRVSLTLRTVLSEDGSSHLPLVQSDKFPPIWGEQNTPPVTWIATPDCERNHVHAVYDAIATQWHHTRAKRGVLWPGATQFLQRLSAGSIVADVGCGDGKYFPAIWEAGSYVIGADISEPLLQTAIADEVVSESALPETRRISRDRYYLRKRPAVLVADCMNVPLRTSSCDAAICVAVLHHLSNLERRKRCIQELVRVVKPGGLVNVQAWALEQEDGSRRTFASNDVYVPFNAQPKYLKMNGSNGANKRDFPSKESNEQCGTKSTAQVYSEALNAEYDDRKGLVVFNRYCHLYRKGELEEIALDVPGVALLESGFESGNYFIIFKVQK
jgi:alkylated DNA repair dioxygenase AlkB/SAM-dependent methyltransferase